MRTECGSTLKKSRVAGVNGKRDLLFSLGAGVGIDLLNKALLKPVTVIIKEYSPIECIVEIRIGDLRAECICCAVDAHLYRALDGVRVQFIDVDARRCVLVDWLFGDRRRNQAAGLAGEQGCGRGHDE